jgi:diaminopimelate decarboxylase
MRIVPMTDLIGQPLYVLGTPQLLLDLDVVDANLKRMFEACRERGVAVRVHFKSLKCAGLPKYIAARGADGFLCAKLNEAEVLGDAGITDVFVANQIVGPIMVRRLADLGSRCTAATRPASDRPRRRAPSTNPVPARMPGTEWPTTNNRQCGTQSWSLVLASGFERRFGG